MPGPLPNIDLPNNPLKSLGFYAQGGQVDGYGGGDRIPALLEAGEHIFSKEEVAAAGGHSVLGLSEGCWAAAARAAEAAFAAGGNWWPGHRQTGHGWACRKRQIDINQAVKQLTISSQVTSRRSGSRCGALSST